MRVWVRTFGDIYLPQAPNGLDHSLDIPPGSTLGDLLGILMIPPESVGIMSVNGARANESRLLHEGDRVDISSPIGGG
ncbi:MAG TPA: sulfur carrier protein ThiS [Firmicutes bacterium]|nr:sulfur carrier protein ThiS [Bacillota bacterium]